MKHWLFDEQGREYLLEEYVTRRRSTYEIAAELDTYPNLVRRALHHHGIELRDKHQAQAEALASGRHAHPTQGRTRSEEERRAISEGMKKNPGDEKTDVGRTDDRGEHLPHD